MNAAATPTFTPQRSQRMLHALADNIDRTTLHPAFELADVVGWTHMDTPEGQRTKFDATSPQERSTHLYTAHEELLLSTYTVDDTVADLPLSYRSFARDARVQLGIAAREVAYALASKDGDKQFAHTIKAQAALNVARDATGLLRDATKPAKG